MLSLNARGDYSFLKAISPYSAGVVALKGFALIEQRLRAAGRPRQALCAIALRSPQPFSFTGFNGFNAGYVDMLRSWEILLDGVNPVARTNVAPQLDPPGEPSLYSFAYT